MPDQTSPTSSKTSGRTAGRRRLGRLSKAAFVVPVALLSAAWTASLTGVGVTGALNVADSYPTLPDGSRVPSQPIDSPATVNPPNAGSPKYTGGNAEQIVSTSSTNGIPASALAAYQRAETVIDAADPTCHIPWQLIAAIGRVESNHGRFGGSMLNAQGIATPSIYGPKLKMADTDNGSLDASSAYDRAVGPMQFIPATWEAVAVDGDNDGKRNPQDINDAALGAAVYLCSGDGDLSTTPDQRTAVYRYNHSTSYVDLVLAIMNAYLDGDFTSLPDSTIAGGYLTPLPGSPSTTDNGRGRDTNGHHKNQGDQTDSGHRNGNDDTPSSTPSSNPPSNSPTQNPTSPSAPGVPGLPSPSSDPTKTIKHTVKHTVKHPIKTVTHTLTAAQAALKCTAMGYIDNPLKSDDPFDQCVKSYETTGKPPSN